LLRHCQLLEIASTSLVQLELPGDVREDQDCGGDNPVLKRMRSESVDQLQTSQMNVKAETTR
jgi:hypothetical protein